MLHLRVSSRKGCPKVPRLRLVSRLRSAVVEEVADGQPAGDLAQLKGWSRLVARVAKCTVALVHLQQFWSAVSCAASGRQRVDLGIDMPGHRDEVEPTVVVKVDECVTPLTHGSEGKPMPGSSPPKFPSAPFSTMKDSCLAADPLPLQRTQLRAFRYKDCVNELDRCASTHRVLPIVV